MESNLPKLPVWLKEIFGDDFSNVHPAVVFKTESAEFRPETLRNVFLSSRMATFGGLPDLHLLPGDVLFGYLLAEQLALSGVLPDAVAKACVGVSFDLTDGFKFGPEVTLGEVVAAVESVLSVKRETLRCQFCH